MSVTRGVCLLGLSVLMGTGSASAQTMGWHVSADVLWLTTRGNDVRAGDVVTTESQASGPAINFVSTDTLTLTPIVPKMGIEPTLLIEGGYRGMTWGYGGRAWWVNTDGSDDAITQSALSSGGVSRSTFVNLFNESFGPFTDNRQTSGLGPVTYSVSNELKHMRVEGYAERLWMTGPMGTVSMRFGIGFAKLESIRDDSVSQTGQFTGGANTFNDDFSLSVVSDSDAKLAGPTFGIAGNMPLGVVDLDWLVSPAVFVGTAETTMTITAVDTGRTRTTATGVTTALSTNTGTLTSGDDRRAIVPTIDLQLRAGYKVIPMLTVGGGVFSSTMFNVPVAPTWDDHNAQVLEQSRDVTFFGGSVFVKFHF